MRATYLGTDDNTGNGDSRIDWYRVTGAVTGAPADEVHDETYGVRDDNTLLDGDGCPIVEGGQTYADVRDAIEKLGAAAPAVSSEPAREAYATLRTAAQFIGEFHDTAASRYLVERCEAAAQTLKGTAPAVREAESTPPGVAEVLAFYGPTWDERVENARNALTEYDRRDHAWDMREAADLALCAAFPDLAPEGQ